MGLIRAVARMTMFLVLTLGLYGLWWIVSFVIPNKLFWRQTVFGYWTSGFVRISGMTVEVIGSPPRPPFFLVSNHLGYVDIGALRSVVNGVFVAKHEILDWPIAGRIISDFGTIFIDRGNRRDIPRAGRRILDRLKDGEGVIVFPEGTNTTGSRVLPFNSSFLRFAADADLSVSFAAITYRTPSDGPPASTHVCWGDDLSFFPHLFRLFSIPTYTAVITFGEELITNSDRKQLALELHQRISEKFISVI